MAIVKMKRLSLLAMKCDKENIYNALIRTGAVQLKRTADIPCCVFADCSVDRDAVSAKIKHVEEAISYVSQQAERYNTLHKDDKAQVAKTTFAKPLAECTFDDFLSLGQENMHKIDEMFALRDEVSILHSQLTQTQSELDKALPYVGLPKPTTEYVDTDSTFVKICLLPNAEQTKLQTLASEYDGVEYEIKDTFTQNCLVVVVCHKSQQDFFLKASALGLVESNFVCEKLPSEHIEELNKKIELLNSQIAEGEKQIANYASYLVEWKIYVDYLGMVDKKLSADSNLQLTNSSFVLEAYYPAESEQIVLNAIDGVTDCYEVYSYDIGEEEFAPTLVKNNGVVKQFEFVTNNYTPPEYHEIDPNPVMSFFYFVIFGLMVADVGYGLLLALVGVLAHFAIKQKTGMRTMLQLFGICGVAAMIVGGMLGSFFSYQIKNVFSWWPVLIPDPSTQPMVMMIISLLAGVVHITAGVACNMAVKIKHKKVLSAWLVDFPWIIVFVSFILTILNPALDMAGYEPYNILRLPNNVASICLYICLGSLAFAILFAGLDTKGIIGKAMKSFGSAYGLINYFSDIMSYIRVFGLMLSSALMGTVINDLAGMVAGNGGLGYFFAAVLLIFAHVFNLVIGILGVYIHDGRLQYVEFFGKFYTGDGQLFVPFCSDTKYTAVSFK